MPFRASEEGILATNPEVDAWFAAYDNPQKDAMQRVREVILAADPRISECIKWKAPTFTYKGNIMSFQPRAKKFVSLMFHRGSEIPGVHTLLEGDSNLVRTAKFADVADVDARAEALAAVFVAWCDAKDGA